MQGCSTTKSWQHYKNDNELGQTYYLVQETGMDFYEDGLRNCWNSIKICVLLISKWILI